MNVTNGPQHKSKSNSKWLIFSIYLTIIFSTEPFYREPLFNSSIPFIKVIQGNNPKNNIFLEIAESISELGNVTVFIPVIISIYNFANIYKTYISLMSLLLSAMMTSILKMIYMSPRPFWKDQDIIIYGCEGGWGNPSGHSLFSTAFYLTLWHIIFDCHELRRKVIFKRISLGVTIFLILLIMFSRMLVGAHSLNQIFFGFFLGFGIYFFFFYVLCVEVNDSKQFAKLLGFKNLIYGFINFFIFLFAFLLFFFNHDENYESEFIESILKQCPSIYPSREFQNEGLVTFVIFLSNLGAFMGIKFEYYFTFKENIQNWQQFNFEIDERSDDESLMTKITINKETQWNHTNSFYSLLRILVILFLSTILMIPYFLIRWDDNFIIIIILKLHLPFFMITFSIFFLFKIILRSFRMINLTLYSMLQESL